MARCTARMSPDFALVEAVETVPALQRKVSALQPPKEARPPFSFYIPSADSERHDLDGPTGLQSFAAELHLVAASFDHLKLLSAKVKAAVMDMRGGVYRTPAEFTEVGLRGAVLIENAEMEQSSPDLYEREVGLYRRVYTVRLEYQTEGQYEEVISG